MKLDNAERQLDAIDQEEATLRSQLTALESQQKLTQAHEARLLNARRMLEGLREKVAYIERTDERTAKRQLFADLVQDIRVDTASDRQVTVTITYVFDQERVAPILTSGR